MSRWAVLAVRCPVMLLSVFGSCGDPVREARIAALGPEAPGTAPGALHRPGQPCLACHDGEQADIPHYTIAGTIYEALGHEVAAPGVRVRLVDARGERFETETNCAGNFFVTRGELRPVFPVWTSLVLEDYQIDMQSPIGRDGSCASCHAKQPSPSATDPVYLYTLRDTDSPHDSTGCP